MRIIYWHSYEKDNKELVSSAMLELIDLLAKPPTRLLVGTEPLSEGMKADVLAIVSKPQPVVETSMELSYMLSDAGVFGTVRLLVICAKDSPLAVAVRENNPAAQWGGRLGHLAVAWRADKYLLWHESLHLLGAEDCYVSSPPYSRSSDCLLSNCIMQYVPTEENVGEWPFVCPRNSGLLAKVEQQHQAALAHLDECTSG